jgi:decaprenylphospho-beta-D-ribofuranose 2-oxidase
VLTRTEPRSRERVELLTGWGRAVTSAARVSRPRSIEELAGGLQRASRRGVIARGLGRSYGDAAQNAGGLVIDLTRFASPITLDDESGTVTCAAGCALDDVLRLIVPRGWFLPVVPGTRSVTVGGAVACDVHGKNHHLDGSFGDHVTGLTLLASDSSMRKLDPLHTPELFRATVGGLGLTGVIVDVAIPLRRIETTAMVVTTERMGTFGALLARMGETDEHHRYSVAWVDCAARGRSLGRGVLMQGDHASRDDVPFETSGDVAVSRSRVGVPRHGSASTLFRRPVVRAFNAVHYRRAREVSRELQSLAQFFFPLDAVANWNRIYGSAGFLQYQFVVPFGEEVTLTAILGLLASAPRPPTLAVLKRFGSERGLMSFPLPGWTLACDLPLPNPSLAKLLDRADGLVAASGGRIYLAKDSRLHAARLRDMYPQLEEWSRIRSTVDPSERMQSDLARRLAMNHRGGRSL